LEYCRLSARKLLIPPYICIMLCRVGMAQRKDAGMKAGEKKAKPKSRYVDTENPELRKVIKTLRALVKEIEPATKESVNAWGVPMFENDNPFGLYMVGKHHVTFGFLFGTSLEDPDGLLEGTGKNLRHVKLRKLEDLHRPALRVLIQAACKLEGKPPMKGMSGRKTVARA
jgi:hypothetical protein